MVKRWAVAAIIIIIAIAGAATYVYFSIFPPAYSGPAAKLIVNSGLVEVNRGSGYTVATSGMALEQGWSVRTGADGRATIIFLDSSVMRLDENTEVRVTRLTTGDNSIVQLEQLAGGTWNKVLKLSGIDEYSVDTPNAVASVRGTAFAVRLDASGDTDVGVAEGNVSVASVSIESATKARSVIAETRVSANQEVSVDTDAPENLAVKPLEADDWTRENLALDTEHEQEIKQKLVEKYSSFIDLAKSQLGLTDAQVREYIDGYVEGRYSIRQAIDQGLIPEQYVSYIPEELRRY